MQAPSAAASVVGHPTIFHEDPDTGALVHDDALNDNIRIHHNHIAMNGGRGGAGGGLSLHTGADNYVVEDNRVCANFSSGNGAGIGHLGLSDNGTIENNTIMFNESFAQAGCACRRWHLHRWQGTARNNRRIVAYAGDRRRHG